MKTIIKELSSTGNFNKKVIHSLFTCYFVNPPHMLNGGSIPLPFSRKPIFCDYITSLYTQYSNYVRKIECFKFTIAKFDIFTVYSFFCPLGYFKNSK